MYFQIAVHVFHRLYCDMRKKEMYSPTKMTFFTGLSNTNYVTTSTALVLIYFISTVG